MPRSESIVVFGCKLMQTCIRWLPRSTSTRSMQGQHAACCTCRIPRTYAHRQTAINTIPDTAADIGETCPPHREIDRQLFYRARAEGRTLISMVYPRRMRAKVVIDRCLWKSTLCNNHQRVTTHSNVKICLIDIVCTLFHYVRHSFHDVTKLYTHWTPKWPTNSCTMYHVSRDDLIYFIIIICLLFIINLHLVNKQIKIKNAIVINIIC